MWVSSNEEGQKVWKDEVVMPLTKKGKHIMTAMRKEYGGSAKAKKVFYASRNKGTITGVDRGFYGHVNSGDFHRTDIIKSTAKE